MLRALRSHLPGAGFRLTYYHDVTLGRRDFYRQLCLALGLSPKATAAAVFQEVTRHVQELGEARMHPLNYSAVSSERASLRASLA